MPKTYAQFLKLQGRSIDYGIKRGEKLKFTQSFDGWLFDEEEWIDLIIHLYFLIDLFEESIINFTNF